MTRIIMHGCNGHMGRVITDLVSKDDECKIVAGIDPFDDGHNDYPVFASVNDCDVEADVIIDFAAAKAEDALLDYCEEKQIPVVVCTTGLTDEQIEHVRKTACKVAVLKSANMSLGINMLMKLLQDATKILAPAGFDVEIVEKHHNKKVDAPSGTAKMIANAINKELDDSMEFNYGRSGNDAKRKEKEIGIHAIRGGTIPGEHTVIFAGLDEIVEIKHTALSKKVFAQGSIKAAQYILNKENGLYDMNNLINNN